MGLIFAPFVFVGSLAVNILLWGLKTVATILLTLAIISIVAWLAMGRPSL